MNNSENNYSTQEFQLKKMALIVKGMFATAAIIFAFAFLIQSTSPATAAGPETTYSTGKYGMQFQSFHDGSATHWYVLAWDTELGRSKMYYGTSKMGKIISAGNEYNLPSSPL